MQHLTRRRKRSPLDEAVARGRRAFRRRRVRRTLRQARKTVRRAVPAGIAAGVGGTAATVAGGLTIRKRLARRKAKTA